MLIIYNNVNNINLSWPARRRPCRRRRHCRPASALASLRLCSLPGRPCASARPAHGLHSLLCPAARIATLAFRLALLFRPGLYCRPPADFLALPDFEHCRVDLPPGCAGRPGFASALLGRRCCRNWPNRPARRCSSHRCRHHTIIPPLRRSNRPHRKYCHSTSCCPPAPAPLASTVISRGYPPAHAMSSVTPSPVIDVVTYPLFSSSLLIPALSIFAFHPSLASTDGCAQISSPDTVYLLRDGRDADACGVSYRVCMMRGCVCVMCMYAVWCIAYAWWCCGVRISRVAVSWYDNRDMYARDEICAMLHVWWSCTCTCICVCDVMMYRWCCRVCCHNVCVWLMMYDAVIRYAVHALRCWVKSAARRCYDAVAVSYRMIVSLSSYARVYG